HLSSILLHLAPKSTLFPYTTLFRSPFLHKIEIIKTTEKAMLKFYEGKIGDVTVIVLYSGVCKVNAAIATEILIDSFGVNIIINRSEEHTSELQSRFDLVCRLLLEKK